VENGYKRYWILRKQGFNDYYECCNCGNLTYNFGNCCYNCGRDMRIKTENGYMIEVREDVQDSVECGLD
jgi:predicted amidophosphoribosyltransferase